MLKKLLRSLRKRIAPTPRDRAIKRWRADRGDERLRYDYPLTAAAVVFDLGGYQGAWAAEIHRRYGCKLEVFEPAEGFAAEIRKRFAGQSAIRVHPCGLGARTRTEQLSLLSDSSSVFRTAGATVPIEIVDVQEWFAREAVSEVALMKVNIEGGEYELLERLLDTGLMGRIRDLQVQFHDLAPDSAARMAKILERLSATHAPTYQYTFVWENWRRR
jgi:FkbM family methyltransferase